MNGIWRWPVRKPKTATLSEQRTITSTPNITSDRCAPTKNERNEHELTDSGGLSWQAQEVFQKMKSFDRLPGAGIPLIQLNMKVGSAKTVKKGIPELKSAGLITETASDEPTLTDKGYKTTF